MSLQVTELRELAQVSLGASGIEAKVTNDYFCCDLSIIMHEYKNIDQFVCQRRLYRPFIDHFLLQHRFIDHFLRSRSHKLVDIILQISFVIYLFFIYITFLLHLFIL